jgi:hypothetical protein
MRQFCLTILIAIAFVLPLCLRAEVDLFGVLMHAKKEAKERLIADANAQGQTMGVVDPCD